MSNDNKLISVIVPIYNVDKYLERCLDSIINQTYKNIEIICVNDGSTDDSLSILYKYAQKDTRIVVINKKNEGVSRARNTGLRLAKGAFISFIDPDDFLELNTYDKCIKKFDDENIDFVNFGYYLMVNNSKITPNNINNFKIKKQKCSIDFLENGSYNTSVWSKIYRKSVIDRYSITFPEDIIYEDEFFSHAYFFCSRYGYFFEDSFYFYTQRDDSITGKVKKLEKKEGGGIINLLKADYFLLNFLKKNNLFNKYFHYLFINSYIEVMNLERDHKEIDKILQISNIIIQSLELTTVEERIIRSIVGDLSYSFYGKKFLNIFKIKKCEKKIRVYIFNIRLFTFKNNIKHIIRKIL